MSVFVCKWNFRWCQIWRHHAMTLKCGAKFSNILIQWSIRMIRAKNYETVSKFVEVMPKILRPLFSRHGVYTVTVVCHWQKHVMTHHRCVQQGSHYKPLQLSTLFYTTLRKDIYGPLRSERSVSFFSYDLQTSHNTPLIMSAAMFSSVFRCMHRE